MTQAERVRNRYHSDIEAGRAYLREQYRKHATRRREARRARYYADLGRAVPPARARAGARVKPVFLCGCGRPAKVEIYGRAGVSRWCAVGCTGKDAVSPV